MNYPTPHGDKLKALLQNTKLPSADVLRVEAAINKYDEWVVEVETASGNGLQCVEALTLSLNQYKNYIDLELIFDSKATPCSDSRTFLYRIRKKVSTRSICGSPSPTSVRDGCISEIPLPCRAFLGNHPSERGGCPSTGLVLIPGKTYLLGAPHGRKPQRERSE